MVITHTQDLDGNVRLYLGGFASMECWLQPNDDGVTWTFHAEEGVSSFPISDDHKRACAEHALRKLCELLNVSPADLKSVPFETIAAQHSTNPFDSRRTPTPKRGARKHAYMSTEPDITRPRSDFTAEDYCSRQRQRQ